MPMRIPLATLLLLLPVLGHAQIDTLPIDLNQEDLIESFLQEQDEDTDFDYNDLFEELEYLRRKPFDLNHITAADLELFPFLSAIQKNALLQYLEQFGPLLSIYELQAVPHFYLTTIQQLLPFVNVSQSAIEPLSGQWKTEGGHQLLMRWSKTLEEKSGFMEDENGESRYLGDRNNLYLRYRFAYSNRLSFGFTAEKDEGETFFKGSNKQGFDFYSTHFFLSNPNSRLKTLALGDYAVSMGQGLILFNGFSARKGPQTTLIKRLGKPLRRYGSVNEVDFFRGAAATYSLHEKLDVTAFFSSKKRDANLDEPDEIIDDVPAANFVTSLQLTGKHRTDTEIADENAIRQNAVGGIIKWKERSWEVALNTLYNSLDKPLNRSSALYSQFYFNGNNLLNTSLDYSATWRNFHFFGETAMSDNGAISTSNGLLASLDQKMDVSLLFRRFPNDYQALNAQPFAETSGGRNETGLYLGVEIRPLKEWTVNAYFDQWEHPWLRFRTDAPGHGQEWLIRLTLRKRRKMEAHVQLRSETKPENVDDETGRFDQIFQRQNFQGRFHLSYRLAKNLEWRTRVYGGFTKIKEEKLNGTALFQDLKYTAVKSGFSVSARYVIFDTDDYAIRFYAYENDVLNSFTVPAYYDRGSRFYVLMGFRMRGGIKLEGRIGRTTYTNRESIGSGQDEINGPSKTDVKVQVRWNF